MFRWLLAIVNHSLILWFVHEFYFCSIAFRAGELSTTELENLMVIVANSRQFKIPNWFMNIKKDHKDGVRLCLTPWTWSWGTISSILRKSGMNVFPKKFVFILSCWIPSILSLYQVWLPLEENTSLLLELRLYINDAACVRFIHARSV